MQALLIRSPKEDTDVKTHPSNGHFRSRSGSLIAPTLTHAADVTRTVVNINASSTFQTIDNFGASDAWSMDPIGKEWSESNKEKIADLLFSQDKGIGLSSWRFNIGAGSSDTDESIITIPWRRSESFKKDENSAYDWSKQAGQQWFLRAANDRGVKDLIGFVNSPPVWMTKNGHAQPDATVGSTNLKSGYEDKFAVVSDGCCGSFRPIRHSF